MPTSICGTCARYLNGRAEAPQVFTTRLKSRMATSLASPVKNATRRCDRSTCLICVAASPFLSGSVAKRKRVAPNTDIEKEPPQQLKAAFPSISREVFMTAAVSASQTGRATLTFAQKFRDACHGDIVVQPGLSDASIA